MPRVARALCVLAFVAPLLFGAACSASSAPLTGTFASLDALGADVLRRVAANDREGLSRLGLSEAEFRDHVWPHLPVSRPERNVPFDYVWGQQHQRSEGFLRQTLARHGGRAYTFVGLRFAGETSEYGPVKVHRDSVLRVRTPEGEETDVRLFGSVLEQAGQFKIYSFVVD